MSDSTAQAADPEQPEEAYTPFPCQVGIVAQEIGSFLEDEDEDQDPGELVTVERYRMQRWFDLLRGGAR